MLYKNKRTKNKKVYAIDRHVPVELPANSYVIKYIAMDFSQDGSIVYFEEGDREDGFAQIIKDLEAGEEVWLYTEIQKLQATFSFIQELKFSADRGRIWLVYFYEGEWQKIAYQL